MKKKTIKVPLESWIYLQDLGHQQRVGGHLSDKARERLTNLMLKPYNKDGHTLMDGDLGGAVGDPNNSWEEGRWTSWSVDTMKKILDNANLPYTDGEDIECIELGLF